MARSLLYQVRAVLAKIEQRTGKSVYWLAYREYTHCGQFIRIHVFHSVGDASDRLFDLSDGLRAESVQAISEWFASFLV